MVGALKVGLIEKDKDYRDQLADVLRANSDLERVSLRRIGWLALLAYWAPCFLSFRLYV